jgi:hypothetical protein
MRSRHAARTGLYRKNIDRRRPKWPILAAAVRLRPVLDRAWGSSTGVIKVGRSYILNMC